MSGYRLGLFLVTFSALAWSTAGLFTRLIALDSPTLLFWRGLFGGLGILLALVFVERRDPLADIRALGSPGWTFVLVSALGTVLFIASLRATTVAHVAIIYAVVPFVAAGLGWLVLSERPAASALIASLAALGGVGVMVGIGGEGSLGGDFLALCMTICMAVMMIIVKKSPRIPTMTAACLSTLASAIVCLPFADLGMPGGMDLVLLVVFGLLNSAVGMVTFAYGARLIPAIETALIGALDAPLAPLWVWLVLGDTPGSHALIGGGIVFAAVVFHVLRAARTVPSVAAA